MLAPLHWTSYIRDDEHPYSDGICLPGFAAIDCHLVVKRHRDPKLRIECSSPIDELIPSLAGLTLSTAVAGNSVEVLENGAFFDVLLQRIRSAQKSVHFVPNW